MTTYDKFLEAINKNITGSRLEKGKVFGKEFAAKACDAILSEERIRAQIEILEYAFTKISFTSVKDLQNYRGILDSLQQQIKEKP